MPFAHKTLRIAGICAALLGAVRGVVADPVTADAHKAIQAAYDRISAAVEKKDLNGATAFYTPDFEMLERGGTRDNLAENRRQIQIMFGMMKAIKATQTIQTFTLKGNQATVIEHTRIEGITVDPQTKRPHKFVGDNISQDLWVKGAKGWLQKRSQTLNERTTIDGKPQS